MPSFRTTQLSPLIKRVWHDPSGEFTRMPDPALSKWARRQVDNQPSTVSDGLEDAALRLPDGSMLARPLGFSAGPQGVRISYTLGPGEHIYGAFDADAVGLDRRGDHAHLVTELHPNRRHQYIDYCEICGTGGVAAAGAGDALQDATHGGSAAAAAGRAAAVDPAGAGTAARAGTSVPEAAAEGIAGAHLQQHHEHVPLAIGTKSSNYGELIVPFFMSSRGYAVYVSNLSTRGVLDFGEAEDDRWTFTAPGGHADIYLIGPAPLPQLLQEYVRLTGHQPLPPTWALGYLQSRFGYESFDHAHRVLERFREEQLPVHGVVFDVQWLEEHVNLRWNPDGFQEPRDNLARIAEQGARVVVITEPGTRTDASNFEPGREAHAFAEAADGELYLTDQWYVSRGIQGYREISEGEGVLVNFFNDAACDWWYDQHLPLVNDGVDGWWLDLNEPEDVEEEVTFPNADWPAPAGRLDGVDARNVFALAQQRSFYHRDLAHTSRRPFLLTRAGAAGSQRYGAAPWSGDIGATWHDMRTQVRLGLTAGMCGIPLWGCDVGGFSGDPGPELFARWMQMGAFLPIYRAHGYMADREPWSQGREALEAMRPALLLRAQLLPSIATWAYESLDAGLPLMRPMLFEDPADPRWANCHDQWMFGPLLVAPVLEEGAASRTVELPDGDWVDLWTQRPHGGSRRIEIPVAHDSVPVFVRAGTLLVTDPEPLARRAHNWPPEQLDVWQVGEAAQSRAHLYVDDGITRLHEQGAYCYQEITVTDGELSVRRVGGGWPPPRLRLTTASPGVIAPY